MPLPEKNPVRVTISITKSDYAYLKDLIEKTADSSKTVPGYIRRLVRHYGWNLREEEAIQKSENHRRELLEELSAYPSDTIS